MASDNPKQQKLSTSTRRTTSLASKVALMAAASTDTEPPGESKCGDPVSMSQLVTELSKQRNNFKEDVATLIQESIRPLQASVDGLRDEVGSFQGRLVAAESLAGDNFQRICEAETVVKTLQTQNAILLERLENLENRSRRSNLCILNIPEGSEDGQDPTKFISKLLKDAMGDDIFPSPPELERAHRTAGPKPAAGRPPRPFILAFHRYREKEAALRWSRQHEVKHQGTTLRIYPDLSIALAKKRSAFNDVKGALYQRGVSFRLLFPARLKVTFKGETHWFETPEEARAFYDRCVAK